jgi:hypothetical protein
MSQEKHYEMQWDCQFCGTAKLLGKTHRFCPNCGAPQNPASRYYPSDDEKVAVEDHVFVGADVTCPACNTLNAGGAEFCGNCGSPLAEGVKASTLGSQMKERDGAFESSGSRDVVKEKFDSEMERIGAVKPKNKEQGFPRWIIVALVASVLVCGFAIWFFTRQVDVSVLVTGHEWTRVTYVDRYNNFTESSWWDIRPAGDNVVRGVCSSRQRSSEQVYDGEECRTVRVDRGDGTFSESQQCSPRYRSEPIYDDWCTFSGTRWESFRQVQMNGGLNDEPTWGDTSVNCSGQSRVGCERINNQQEQYLLVLRGDGEEYRCPFPRAEWEEIRIETTYTMKVNAVDRSAADCDSLVRP